MDKTFWLKARAAKHIFKKIQSFSAYKRLTLDLKTQTDRKWRDEKRYFFQTETKRKAGVAIFMLDKIVVRTQIVIRDKEGHYEGIKESIQQEVIIFLTIY